MRLETQTLPRIFFRAFGLCVLLLVCTQVATPRLLASDSYGPVLSETNPLSPPRADGPVVVQAAFFLQDIDDIDDEAVK